VQGFDTLTPLAYSVECTSILKSYFFNYLNPFFFLHQALRPKSVGRAGWPGTDSNLDGDGDWDGDGDGDGNGDGDGGRGGDGEGGSDIQV
jgi:hypothetical protein